MYLLIFFRRDVSINFYIINNYNKNNFHFVGQQKNYNKISKKKKTVIIKFI